MPVAWKPVFSVEEIAQLSDRLFAWCINSSEQRYSELIRYMQPGYCRGAGTGRACYNQRLGLGAVSQSLTGLQRELIRSHEILCRALPAYRRPMETFT